MDLVHTPEKLDCGHFCFIHFLMTHLQISPVVMLSQL